MRSEFSEETKNKYIGSLRDDNEPHVYAMVSECHHGLFNATINGPPRNQVTIALHHTIIVTPTLLGIDYHCDIDLVLTDCFRGRP